MRENFRTSSNAALKKANAIIIRTWGCREFPAKFRLYEFETVPTAYANVEKDLGYMLYDMDYSDLNDIKPMFFRAVLKNGVLDLTQSEVHK